MIQESKTSPAADTPSSAADAGQPPADSPEPAQACCSACGARLRSSSRFCSDCGAAQAPSAEDVAAAIHSRFGGSSADLAELLAANGHVVSCPRCDELNDASAAWCRHCGQQLPAPDVSLPATPAEEVSRTSETDDGRQQGRVSPAERRGRPPARRHGPGIALIALLGVTAAALWLGRSPTDPASETAHNVISSSVPAMQPPEPVVSTAAVEPVAALPVAPSPAPGANGEEQEKASPPLPPPGAAQQRTPAPEPARKKAAKTAVLRAAAPIATDELYRQRAAQRCAEGLSGLICRQKLRFELCNGKWTQEAQAGMSICRLNG